MLIEFNQKPNLKKLRKIFTYNWQLEIIKFLYDWYNNNDTIYINTSGTINNIKYFKVKKIFMINSAYMTIKYFRLKSHKNTLLCLPIKYIAAKMVLIRSLILKWNVLCINPCSNPLKGINQSFYFISMIPMQVLNTVIYTNNIIKKILIGGGIISNYIEEKIKNSNIECYHSFGMSETLGHIAIRKINKYNSQKYYNPLSGIKLSVNNNNCLIIYAPRLIDKILITKDIVSFNKNGLFKWIGRYDNIINTGGVKISPELFENHLFSIIKKPLFIFGIPDKYLGEKLTLFIENKFDININLKNDIFIINNKYLLPKSIFFIPKFIRTFSGKIKRKKTVQIFLKKFNK